MQVTRSGTLVQGDPSVPGSTQTSSLRYFHHDQQGSISAVTDEAGFLLERMAYDPWGKRRGVGGAADVTDSMVGRTTDRGFTEHEHLDEMGLVHMNGRIYDPLVGRFMSADPFIQAPSMLQSYNRYAYVMNNPLNLTDPSGYNWWTRAMHLGDRISSIGVSLGSPALYHRSVNFLSGSGGYQLKSAALGYVSLYCGPWVAACNGGFQAALAKGYGASDGDAFRTGAVAAISTGAFQLAGQVTPGDSGSFLRYAAHAGAGCVSAAAGGGNCGQGAVSAVFGKFATNAIDAQPGQFDAFQAAATVVAGGVGSVIGGGKFANGAMTAAYGYLYNAMSSPDVLPSRGGQVARIITQAGGVESFNPITTFEPYMEVGPGGERTQLRIDTLNGKSIEAQVRIDRYSIKGGGTLVIEDHFLGHNNAGQSAQEPHFNARIERADGSTLRNLTVNGNPHFGYQPTHAYQSSNIRYSGTQGVRPTVRAIMRASGWMY
jgi:RHS repeat-associated protein